METVLLRAGMLNRFIVIKPADGPRYARRNNNGSIGIQEESVFSEVVKIEVERATKYPNYVHLRFCYNNKYWARQPPRAGATNAFLVAESNEPEEDLTKLSCTLFHAVLVRNGVFNFIHVPSGWYVSLVNHTTILDARLQSTITPVTASHLSFVNWDELVKLPPRIALKGFNDSYLGGYVHQRTNYLHLSFSDRNAKESIHEVHLMDDGHVRIKSVYFDRFWRRGSNNWIVCDATNTAVSARDRDTLFWPIHNGNEGDAIVLRNAGNNMFCIFDRDYLIASGRTMTEQAKLTVEELVLGRKIYNVRYMVDNSRVFNRSPYLAGTTTAVNNGDTEGSIAVEVGYQNTRLETFSRSVSLTAGVKSSLEAGVPLIGKAGVELSLETTVSKEWNKTNSDTVTVTATGAVAVPPRTVAVVDYVGTMGTCDVPFSYTQEDQSSTHGNITTSEHKDGVFRGVNAYDFSFIITGTRSLPPEEMEERL